MTNNNLIINQDKTSKNGRSQNLRTPTIMWRCQTRFIFYLFFENVRATLDSQVLLFLDCCPRKATQSRSLRCRCKAQKLKRSINAKIQIGKYKVFVRKLKFPKIILLRAPASQNGLREKIRDLSSSSINFQRERERESWPAQPDQTRLDWTGPGVSE